MHKNSTNYLQLLGTLSLAATFSDLSSKFLGGRDNRMSQIELNRAVQNADSQSSLLPSRRSSGNGGIGRVSFRGGGGRGHSPPLGSWLPPLESSHHPYMQYICTSKRFKW